VAAPFLSSVWDRKAKGQAAPPKPRQLIVMFTHYGCITTKWFPVKSHGPLVASDLVYTLAPLQPYVKKLLIPRGIRSMNEWTSDNRGAGHGLGQGNDIHLNNSASFFTCQPVTPNSNDPYSFDSSFKFNALPIGTSLDHVMAQQLSAKGIPLFMRVGNRNDGPQSAISFVKDSGAAPDAAAKMFPGLGTPMQVFSELTNLLKPGQPMSPDTYAMTRGKRVADLVKASLADFERQDMSADDRNKVAVWKSMINDVGTVASNLCSKDLADQLGATANASATISNISNAITPELDGADMYSVMAVLAASCNYNPVTILKYPPSYVYNGIGVNADSDNLSHRLDNAGLSGTCATNVLDMLRKIDTYYATKFAKLVGMLDGIPNGDGSTLLDSSAAVWFQDSSDGEARNLNNLPILQAGSCGGYFKTGWTINVDPGNPGDPNLTQGNSEAQCMPGGTNMVNALAKETGTDPKLANGPINKYFYNLMNAVGVKGDANGFPKVGGSAEVTQFGYSDLTTDFCGGFGAVAGATIHSPGEYTALKAT